LTIRPGGLTVARRFCLVCGGKLSRTETRDKRWTYLSKKTYYTCNNCGRTWLYSPELTCPVLLRK